MRNHDKGQHGKRRHHGRTKMGNDLPQSIVTPEDVVLIRELSESGMTYREIGVKFDIHHTTAWRIANYVDWRHVN